MPKVRLIGVAMVTYTRTIEVPDDELKEFLEACDDGETLLCNLNTDDLAHQEIGSWEHFEVEVLD